MMRWLLRWFRYRSVRREMTRLDHLRGLPELPEIKPVRRCR